ncbi:hypothetical protein J5N97_009414 [Dioscorea zingiberensis]|uniref:Uncharacterized protein n=1 Tax=Dioscorea zingiberensis TaxID=325984 RepID=A0A9D5CY74_9LILI|nr:hypothetical protein J5N97_009414 [Dioscorea zingiberensis]
MQRVLLKRGAWTPEEDQILASYIEAHGPQKWSHVPKKAGINRCGKSCRLRWLNYLRPDIKRGNITPEEEDLILRLHKLLGNRWSLIAGRLPGRTDNEIKNYWNTVIKKKLQIREESRSESENRSVVRTKATRCTRALIDQELINGGEVGFKESTVVALSEDCLQDHDSLFFIEEMVDHEMCFSWELDSLSWIMD